MKSKSKKKLHSLKQYETIMEVDNGPLEDYVIYEVGPRP